MNLRRRTKRRIELLQTRRAAERERRLYDLCRCGDEILKFDSEEEARAYSAPPVKCEKCGRDKFRVKGFPALDARIRESDMNRIGG